MWGALFYKVYLGFADNLFEMFEPKTVIRKNK